MVDFAGWSMPIQYHSIVKEHNAVRTAAGLFDVSHMGRLRFANPEAEQILDGLTTRKVAGMGVGRIRYSLMTNEKGGILDDILVYRLEEADGSDKFWMVVNASNRPKILDWLAKNDPENKAGLEDKTAETAMIAFQGPKAIALTEKVLGISVADMKYYTGKFVDYQGHQVLVSRTGYTGEDGVEFTVPGEVAVSLWEALLVKEEGVEAVGLGARDTLRLEAAMPLYGHELSEQLNPVQAGLGFALSLKEREFIGSDVIRAAKEQTDLRVRVGLELEGRRPAREESKILQGETEIGIVTSGTFSPTLGKPIAMGYVEKSCSEPGTQLNVDIRGKIHSAVVVELPFYTRPN